jgi:hypothetical protein
MLPTIVSLDDLAVTPELQDKRPQEKGHPLARKVLQAHTSLQCNITNHVIEAMTRRNAGSTGQTGMKLSQSEYNEFHHVRTNSMKLRMERYYMVHPGPNVMADCQSVANSDPKSIDSDTFLKWVSDNISWSKTKGNSHL